MRNKQIEKRNFPVNVFIKWLNLHINWCCFEYFINYKLFSFKYSNSFLSSSVSFNCDQQSLINESWLSVSFTLCCQSLGVRVGSSYSLYILLFYRLNIVFFDARAYIARMMSVCLSVCLSVCPSVGNIWKNAFLLYNTLSSSSSV